MPVMKICLGCGGLFPVLKDGRCAACKRLMWREYNQTQRDPVARKVYGSAEYRRARAIVLANATHCAWCKRPASEVGELTAGHLLPIHVDPDAAADPAGMAPQCRSCQELEKHRRTGGRR